VSPRPALILLALLALASTEAGESCWPGPPGSDPAACPPNDPGHAGRWEYRGDIPAGIDRQRVHPSELALGAIGISLDRAWQETIGLDEVVIAVLDSGMRWEHADLRRKIHLNRGELPLPQGATAYDANGDGVFDVDDYAGDPRVGDANANGLLDGQDLIRAFADCRDADGNGYADDIAGYDFAGGEHCGAAGGDHDPADDTAFGHGSGIAATAAAEANNGLGDAGVCPRCRVLPVRVGDSFVVDANRFAAGLDFATASGAAVVASALGAYNNTPAAREAIDRAWAAGVTVVASAADEYSYHHNFPSVHNHTIYVNSIRYNHEGDFRDATSFWGVNPCTNYGARVSITVPAKSCSSGSTSRLAGVAGLIQSAALAGGRGRLHPEELFQILRATADDLDNSAPDWSGVLYPARPGFDQLYGHGRLHAWRAVRAAASGEIPPIVDLDGPDWFAHVSPRVTPRVDVRGSARAPRAAAGTYRLEYALGVEPREDAYRLVAAGALPRDREPLGTLDFSSLPVPGGPAPRNREERDRYSVTLRLRATDDRGRMAEARRSFFVHDDPTWKDGFPRALGASGEAAPVLFDLDRDGRDEIVLPTADGRLRILGWTPAGPVEVEAALDERPRLARGAAGDPGARRETVLRAAAVGDLDGTGAPAIVVASREGRVYAFDRAGRRRAGFPVSMPASLGGPASAALPIETGALTSPVLADLDGAPGAEIVVAGLDGCLHAWRGNGAALAGFPVRIENAAAGAGREKIVSTPAVGDLDGDGRPEIVLGSNGHGAGQARVWAVRAEGYRHAGGPFVPGWEPLGLPALRPDLLPTLAAGVAMTPLLEDVDGDTDLEAVLYAVTGSAIVVVDHEAGQGPRIVRRLALSPGPGSELTGVSFLGGTGSGLLADTDGDGAPEVYAPLLPLRMLTLRARPGTPLDVPLALGGWDLGPPAAGARRSALPMTRGYPRRMEDLMIFAAPAAADVDGDGVAEVLMGSGGYLLHAFRGAGGEAAGFPKFTGGWIFSAPATGDFDGDGRTDVVAVTREGYLFAWDTPGASPLRSRSMTRCLSRTSKREGASCAEPTRSASRPSGS